MDVTPPLSAQAVRATSTIAIPERRHWTTLPVMNDYSAATVMASTSGLVATKLEGEKASKNVRIEINLQAELSRGSILPRRDNSLP